MKIIYAVIEMVIEFKDMRECTDYLNQHPEFNSRDIEETGVDGRVSVTGWKRYRNYAGC